MFTGIVEDIGEIVEKSAGKLKIRTALREIKPGDSISVNGTCLTVIEINSKGLSFDFSPETGSITFIGKLGEGDKVNIERALKMGDRLGGHFISGHIEAIGKILSIKKEDNSVVFEITLPKELNKYVINKGSIAVDGVSLTVVRAWDGFFTVTVIPHTLKQSTLGFRKTGDSVNIETDLMAKYAEKIFIESEKTGISVEKLKKYGF